MTEQSPTPLAHALRFFRLFADLLNVKNVTLLATLALIAVSGLLGGWSTATATSSEIAVIDDGDDAPVAPFTLRIAEAFWSDDPGPFGFPGESTFLFLRAQVASNHEEAIPANVLTAALTAFLEVPPPQLPGWYSNSVTSDDSIGTPTAYRAIDGHPARGVQPGITQEYWFVWTLPHTTTKQAEIEMHLYSHTWRKSSLEDAHIWADRTLIATQTIFAPEREVSGL